MWHKESIRTGKKKENRRKKEEENIDKKRKRPSKESFSTGRLKKGGRANGRVRVSKRVLHFHNF